MLDEYYEAAKDASADYTNKAAALRFFKLHEQQEDPKPDLESRYLQMNDPAASCRVSVLAYSNNLSCLREVLG